MKGIYLLRKFANEQGIDSKKVDKFLETFNPTDLETLLSIPHDMLVHHKYITFLNEPLKSFIIDDMSIERYKTVTAKGVVQALDDYKEDLGDSLEDYHISYDYYNNVMEELDEIEEQIVKERFGSVIMDW